MGSLPTHSKSTKLNSMKKLTATLCLTIAVLLGSSEISYALPECLGSPLTGYVSDIRTWNNCSGTHIWGPKR